MENNLQDETKAAPKKPSGLFRYDWNKNIVDDVNAPQLYSKKIINVFSILFSVVFGGILMSMNLSRTNNKKGILPVMAFSVAYTVLMMYLLSFIPGSTSVFTLILNAVGAMILYHYFWEKFIGVDFKYRTRPYWIPLIIALVICGTLIWWLIAAALAH